MLFRSITRLLGKRESGWNPWIEVETSKSYESFDVAINVYRQYLDKLLKDDNLRMPTKRCYDSRTNMLIKFNNQRRVPIKYVYQFDRFFVSEFMNWVYIDLDNTICTHNHYFVWLNNFSGFLVQKMYLKTKPTEGLKTLRDKGEKNRKA